MSILAWSGFSDVLLLQDQREWFFSASGFLRKPKSGRIGHEWVVIVVSVRFVRCAALSVAPHTVFQDGIPHKTTSGATKCSILADSRRIDCPRKSYSLLHRGLGCAASVYWIPNGEQYHDGNRVQNCNC